MSRRIFALFLFLLNFSSTKALSWKQPFAWARRKRYTPLVMFYDKLAPEDDKYRVALEKAVREVEWEFGVPVDRVGVDERNCAHYALRELTMRDPPFLYNRESCQSVFVVRPLEPLDTPVDEEDIDLEYVEMRKKAVKSLKDAGLIKTNDVNELRETAVLIDRRRIRAWAKGRILSPQVDGDLSKPVVRRPKAKKY